MQTVVTHGANHIVPSNVKIIYVLLLFSDGIAYILIIPATMFVNQDSGTHSFYSSHHNFSIFVKLKTIRASRRGGGLLYIPCDMGKMVIHYV